MNSLVHEVLQHTAIVKRVCEREGECVWERERARERKKERHTQRDRDTGNERVCVSENERERVERRK